MIQTLYVYFKNKSIKATFHENEPSHNNLTIFEPAFFSRCIFHYFSLILSMFFLCRRFGLVFWIHWEREREWESARAKNKNGFASFQVLKIKLWLMKFCWVSTSNYQINLDMQNRNWYGQMLLVSLLLLFFFSWCWDNKAEVDIYIFFNAFGTSNDYIIFLRSQLKCDIQNGHICWKVSIKNLNFCSL